MSRSFAFASLPRRLAAFGVDYLFVAVYIAALAAVFLGLAGGSRTVEAMFADPLRGQLLALVLLTLPVVLYFAGWEGSTRQSTPGKRLVGIQVLRGDGGRLTWSRSLVRSAAKFAPWEIAHTFLWRIPGWPGSVDIIPTGVVVGFGVVWLLVVCYLAAPLLSRKHQAPYDRLAGSVVVVASRMG